MTAAGDGVTQETLRKLRMAAARHTRVAHEAEDLVQDVLLFAIERGRHCGDARFLPWAIGAIRNHARFTARTAVRRRRREQLYDPAAGEAQRPHFPDAFIATLPPSRKVVALLVNLGMSRPEIGHLLGLSGFALRQRLSGLRRDMAAHPAHVEFGEPLGPELPDGLKRRELKAVMPRTTVRALAIRDPDGNALFFSRRDHVSGLDGN